MGATAIAQSNPEVPAAEVSNKYGCMLRAKKSDMQRVNFDGTMVGEEGSYELLACKEGSVFGNEYTENTVWSGSVCADAGRPGLGPEFYQQFDNLYYTFNEIHFIGFFNYWKAEESSWVYCDDRGGIDENGNMTKSITFEIGVYEEGEDGLPGKCVLKKDMELVGENTRVMRGREDTGFTYLYEFTAKLDQEIDLEHGFIQVNAKDMGDAPSCWFSLFTVNGNGLAYTKDIDTEEYTSWRTMTYCLYGTGERNAKKALQLERFLAPETTADGKYERVEVELSNIGTEAVSDARLELYVGDELVATEDVPATLQPEDYYKYTFTARADCSQGKTVTVRNVTPGDEKKAYETISTAVGVAPASEYPTCRTTMSDIINITKVSMGEICNETGGSRYSDFTDQSTTIRLGETQTLEITLDTDDEKPSLAAYIDWNNDYAFGSDEQVTFDSFEADNTSGKGVATVSVPATATAGPHRLRIVATMSYRTPAPNKTHPAGEVEDYTVIVAPAETAPQFAVDKTVVEQILADNKETAGLSISNAGKSALTTGIAFNYILPGVPSNAAASAPKAPFNGQILTAGRMNAKHTAPARSEATQFVLNYDGDNRDCVGVGNSTQAVFASLYPGAMLANLEGMTISSVDVFIGEVPGLATVVIYGQSKQNVCDNPVCEQVFTPTPHAWNHIELDAPVTIGTTDLWVGVKMEQMEPNTYCIGVDYGPARTGFGDLVNIGSLEWWSMADLGRSYNYNIRANVTGTRTPAISWLTLDKESMEVAPGTTEKVNIGFDAESLKPGIYEATIELTSNDPFNSTVTIPVYMVKGEATAISTIRGNKPAIVLNGGTLSVKAAKDIRSIKVCDLNGRTVMSEAVSGNAVTANLSAFGKGIYVVTVQHADGTTVSMKVPVIK